MHPKKQVVTVGRTRIQHDGPVIGGRRYNAAIGQWLSQGTWATETYSNTCTDTDNGDHKSPNALGITKILRAVTPFNGSLPSGHQYENWYPTGMSTVPGHLAVGEPSLGDATNQLMARSNPGRAEVSIPRSLAELRDVPHLIKQGGDIYRRYIMGGGSRRANAIARNAWSNMQDGAGAYIGYQFGIRPILQDLSTLLDFQKQFAKRANELERLFSKGGLRRSLSLGQFAGSQSDVVTIESGAGLFDARRTRTTSKKVWGTIRWTPASGFNPPSTPARYQTLARAAVLGLGRVSNRDINSGHTGQDFGDYWDIIPWSWMSDWCADVGTYLHAHNNRIPCNPGAMCIMVQATSKYSWSRTNNPSVSGGTGYTERTTKDRFVRTSASPPTIHLPFLNSGRLSIVTALAATRGRHIAR